MFRIASESFGFNSIALLKHSKASSILFKDLNSIISECQFGDVHFNLIKDDVIKEFTEINKILNEGKVVVLTAKENIEIFNLLDIEYELLGTDFGREIIVIEK